MHEIVSIPLADLLVYPKNARLKDEQTTQQSTLLALAKQQGSRILKLAADIVEHGVDPTTLPLVVPTPDHKKRYLVLEGNRRVTALKGLETPSLILPAFDNTAQSKLLALAKKYSDSPIAEITCVLFADEDEADHWINLRHTGQNEGAGLVEWGAEEKDRYAARHRKRSPAGQVLEYVGSLGTLSNKAENSGKEIITTLARLLSTPDVRRALGIDVKSGEVIQIQNTPYVQKSLTKIVEDLKTGVIKVGDVYTSEDRIAHAKKIARTLKLSVNKPLDTPTRLGDASPLPKVSPRKKSRKRKEKADRDALIPKECVLDINPPRINSIYVELSDLSVENFTNASSVTLRVFVELSVDHYIEVHSLLSQQEMRDQNLAKRLKIVANHLLKQRKISSQLEVAVKKIADSTFLLAASTVTFNQYVHNKYVFPKPTELRISWDELQPFIEAIWD